MADAPGRPTSETTSVFFDNLSEFHRLPRGAVARLRPGALGTEARCSAAYPLCQRLEPRMALASAPKPANNSSRPPEPTRMSSPAPPTRMSSAAPPTRMSLPSWPAVLPALVVGGLAGVGASAGDVNGFLVADYSVIDYGVAYSPHSSLWLSRT